MVTPAQHAVCARFGVACVPTASDAIIGVADGVRDGLTPLHGLRHPPRADAAGWFVWAGEYSDAADFFKPQHALHVLESRPEVEPYLGLPPGWRFLIASGYEDVWFDASLLDT